MVTIDLHGLTLEEAREKVIHFLDGAYQHREQVVRIIHGQGKHSENFPVIKSFVRHWLQESDFGQHKIAEIFRGEDGSPYSMANPGETIVVLKIPGMIEQLENQPLISIDEEEDREARRNSKAIRAERLRTTRRRNSRLK
jgi:hypothetical protein